jgi:glycosyltransferase involved in cell wall biosynthesis
LLRWLRHERRVAELVRRLARARRPDLVDYHTARPFGEQPLFTLAELGVPVVATLHDAWLVCPRLMLLRSPTSTECSGPGLRCLECMYSHYDGSHWRAAFKLPWRLLKLRAFLAYRLWRRRQARRCVAAALARSDFMADVHRPHLAGPVEHIPLGLDLPEAPDDPPDRPRSPLRFGFLGGFQATKGLGQVLDAAAALQRDGLAFELHVWGPNQEQGAAEIAARKLQGRVFLHGLYRAEECWRAYREIDVAVMATTVCEPFGRIPLEAAAMGVPTIAPAVGGIRETIRHSIDGLHYRFRHPHDLELQMRRVLTEPELYKHLASNVQRPVETQTMIPAVEALYFKALAHVRPKPVAIPSRASL